MLSPMSPASVSGFSSFPLVVAYSRPETDNLLHTDLEGKWGMRIESALLVKKVKVCSYALFTMRPARFLTSSTDTRRVQWGHLARFRALHTRAHTDAHGQREHAHKGRKAVAQGGSCTHFHASVVFIIILCLAGTQPTLL